MERLGRYELLRRIAIGGMAEIYIARETGLAGFQRPAVVKRILPPLAADDGFVQLFLDEARLAARLTHPKIVHIYELGHEEESYYIAMEFVAGCDLESLVAAEPGPVPFAEAIHLTAEVLEGLHYAHSLTDQHGVPLGVVHRDVAPKNVLVSLDGAVKIVDFGIAKARTKVSVTAPGLVMGTFSTMSPEQGCGRPVDRRTDVFAAGAMLYRMLTGESPYRAEGMLLVEQVRNGMFESPCRRNPEVPASVERIVLQAMARKAEDRYPTAAHMRRDLLAAARELGLAADEDSLAALVQSRLPHLGSLVSAWLSDEPLVTDPDLVETVAEDEEAVSSRGARPGARRSSAAPSSWEPVGGFAGSDEAEAPTAAVELPEYALARRGAALDSSLEAPPSPDDEDERETWPSDIDDGYDDPYGLDEPATIMEAPRFPSSDLVEPLDLGSAPDDDLVGLELPADVAEELAWADPELTGELAGGDLEDQDAEPATLVSPPPGRRRPTGGGPPSG